MRLIQQAGDMKRFNRPNFKRIFKILRRKMTPHIYHNDKEIQLEFKRYTPKLIDQLVKIIASYPVDTFQKKLLDYAVENSQLTETELQKKLLEEKYITSDAMLQMLSGNLVDEQFLNSQMNANIAFFKAIVNEKKLSDAAKTLFATESDSEFWQEQDYGHIKACVAFFRSTYEVGK